MYARAFMEGRLTDDDLETIAAHALAWEEKLLRDRNRDAQHVESA